MDATEVFSKITYLKEGMEKLLAQGPAVSSEDLKALLAAVEANANPVINLDAERFAKAVLPELVAKMPLLNPDAVARKLGPVLTAGFPTPDKLREAGEVAADKLNQEFARLEQQMQSFLNRMDSRMRAMEERVKEAVESVPGTVGLDAFYDPRIFFVVFSVPLVCIIVLMFNAFVMRVPKEEYERVALANERTTDAGIFYSNQIKEYKQKFPKAASYFRDYHPVPAQPVAQ